MNAGRHASAVSGFRQLTSAKWFHNEQLAAWTIVSHYQFNAMENHQHLSACVVTVGLLGAITDSASRQDTTGV